MIGALAFLPGLPVGMLLSQLLEAAVLHLFGMPYSLHSPFSPSAALLTLVCFSLMLLYALLRSFKWIRKTRLYDLLIQDHRNENPPLSGGRSSGIVFSASAACGAAGLLLLYVQPMGQGYDVLAGTILLAGFLFGFFLSVPSFLAARLTRLPAWKYNRCRLVVLRNFTAKAHSMSVTMGILSVLFMLAVTFMGAGTAVSMIADRNVELNVFDIMLLHREEVQVSSPYEELLCRNFPIQASHTYGIYSDTSTEFLTVCRNAMKDMNRSGSSFIAEYQSDTYMKQSDYIKLRHILGYDVVQLDPSASYVHCVPAMQPYINRYIKEAAPACGGYTFAADRIFCEPFSQNESYGNGLDYILIVPDQAAVSMKVLYSLYAAVTENPVSVAGLKRTAESCGGVSLLQRGIAKSVQGSRYYSSLTDTGVDYLSGKWVEKQALSNLYVIAVCLFYLALILEITGAAILAAQILCDTEKKQRQERILGQLGMNSRLIAGLNSCQLSLLFLLPALPALLVGGSFIYICAQKMQMSAFRVPAFTGNLWILQSSGIAFGFFMLLYAIYFTAARISYERQYRL